MLETTVLLLAGFFLLIMAIMKASPLVIGVFYFTMLGPFRLPVENIEKGVLVFLSWWAVLLVSIVFVSHVKVNICHFGLAQVKRKGGVFFVAVGLVYFSLIIIWISQSGLTQFQSSKIKNYGSFYHIVGYLLKAFEVYAILTLAFYKKTIQREHLYLSLFIFSLSLVMAYVSSNRGEVLASLIFIGTVRYFMIRSVYKKIRYAFPVAFICCVAFFVVADMTAKRAGVDFLEGASKVFDTTHGVMGNGFSPGRDVYVIDYYEKSGPLLEPLYLLSGFYGLIPRVLWPDKPNTGTGKIVGTFVFGTGDGHLDRGAGIPISVPAQVSLVFGTPFFFVALIGFGFATIVMALLCKKFPLLIYPLVTLFYAPMGSDIGKVQVVTIITIISLFFSYKAMGLRILYLRSNHEVMKCPPTRVAHTSTTVVTE